jgi:hypothetical protein
LTSAIGSYESSYALQGQTVTVRRSLEIRLNGVLVQPLEYPALRQMALGAMRDLRAQLVY